MRFHLLALAAAMLIGVADSKVKCNECSVRSGDACGSTCTGDYCLYLGTVVNGVARTTLVCYPTDHYIMIDGTTATANGGCFRKNVGDDQFSYEVCNNGNFCDTHCSGSSLSLLLALLLLPLTYLLKN
ncbi:hypothetical protein PFISCL1PPCAC_3786 [Pristionchus fissidentatus]|uniref:UPAR/Ly6 domain-containing protein n=1 Tax=Pristionchus fissidentatus TaxID=1538716 RepID=A0AAV5V3N1_9BILA|nr:hypothetical protein PFISCL1PPCAC_3786 [Pristionchus fissidentatus]